MKKFIVTTSIYPISNATKKFASFKDWKFIIVGDTKTPHDEYREFEKINNNVIYLDCEYQENKWNEISQLIGFNTINRRNIGFLEAIERGAEIIASVDDDNIPYDNWGENLLIGKEIEVNFYNTNDICFDPISVTNHSNLWHRGFPIQMLHKRTINCDLKRKKIIPDIQADFWNGDPDIDSICRFEHLPTCNFDDAYFPLATNTFSPFNSQNTFFSRKALKDYLVIPFIGRMDDIWASYYMESIGYQVIYNKASVFQDRNVQDLTKNFKDEIIGYCNTLNLLKQLKLNNDKIQTLYEFLPKKSVNILIKYFDIMRSL